MPVPLCEIAARGDRPPRQRVDRASGRSLRSSDAAGFLVTRIEPTSG
jgi:hypothetical protein